MADADIIAAVVALLKADAGVSALVGTDVYGVEMPASVVARMPINAIVVQPSGGASLTEGSDAALDAQRIDIMAYGATPNTANSVRRAAAWALTRTKRCVFADTLIHWINKAGGFYAARERDGLWPQSFQSFQILYSTQEI
jgi:hypothetical protein